MTFEEYLSLNFDSDITEFRLVATKSDRGVVDFYIHPLDADGETPYFVVSGDTVMPVAMDAA